MLISRSRPARLRTAICGLVTLIALAGAPQASFAAVAVKTVVLVHGAFGDGSAWSKVIPLLEAKGLKVVAVQNPLTSLADDVAATNRIIALQEGLVLLVGHSYAGAVITEAGDDPKVAGLVYIAAFTPEIGEAVGDMGKNFPVPPGSAQVTTDASAFLSMTEKGINEDFGPDLPPGQRALLFATQGQTAAAVFGAKVTKAAWKSKPSWYVVAGNDHMISPQFEQSMAEKIGAKTITIRSSHLVMLAHPQELAAFIESAAKGIR